MNVKENAKSIVLFVLYSLLLLPLLYLKMSNIRMFMVYAFVWIAIGFVVLLGFFASRKEYSEREDLENSPYDECQRVTRNIYAFRALNIVFVLVILEAFISSYYTWAEPITRSMIVLSVPYIYFITNLASHSALMSFVSRKSFTYFLSLFVFDILYTIWIIRDIYLEGLNGVIKDGVFQNNVGILIFCILYLYGLLAFIGSIDASRCRCFVYISKVGCNGFIFH